MVGFVRSAAALILFQTFIFSNSVLPVQAATLSFPADGPITAVENALAPETASRGLHDPVSVLQPESGSVFGQDATAGSLFLSVLGSSPAMAVHSGLLIDDGSAGANGRMVLHRLVSALGYVVLSLYLLIALFAMARTLAECNETGSHSVAQRVAGCVLCLFWLPLALLFLVIEQVRGREKTPLEMRQSN